VIENMRCGGNSRTEGSTLPACHLSWRHPADQSVAAPGRLQQNGHAVRGGLLFFL
jgi:hypothetical protein